MKHLVAERDQEHGRRTFRIGAKSNRGGNRTSNRLAVTHVADGIIIVMRRHECRSLPTVRAGVSQRLALVDAKSIARCEMSERQVRNRPVGSAHGFVLHSAYPICLGTLRARHNAKQECGGVGLEVHNGIRLCAPAAAISSARFAVSCPLTCDRSTARAGISTSPGTGGASSAWPLK